MSTTGCGVKERGTEVRRTRVVTALLAIALVAAACTSHNAITPGGSGSTAPTVPKTVTVVNAMDLSCPAAVTSTCVAVGNVSTIGGIVPGLFLGAQVGTDAYLSYIDSTQGGVDGRKLVLDAKDDQFNGDDNRSETQALISKVIGFAGSFSLEDQDGGIILSQNPDVPNVSVSLSPYTNSLANTFSVNPLSNGWGTGGLTYFKDHYPNAIKHAGLLVAEESSAEYSAAGLKAAMQHLGYNVVYDQEYGPLSTDFTPQILAMKNDGVQFVDLSSTDANNAEHMVDEMYQQDYHPQVIESAGTTYVDNFTQEAGGAQVTNGIWIDQGAALYLGGDSSSVPAVDTFLEWVEKVHPGFTADLYTLYGWASAQLLVQALKSAGSTPTSSSVLAALKQVTSFNASGLLAPGNPAGKQPTSCYLLARYVNGVVVRQPPSPKSGFICGAPYYHPPS
jgi:branched-chain amino acid transport system substrate-binding protein